MQGTPQRDHEWEHWPGRPTGEERVRSRLRALFVPTEAEDAITELIAEHSRELESRAAELRGAVAELEQREARARELHARVEQVLREGSAELDVRHSELVVRTTDLDGREAALAEAEERVEERARAFGAVELRGAAVERREQALEERESVLDSREQELREREWELARREAAMGPEATPKRAAPDDAYIAFTLEHGYRLLERDGAVPQPGDTIELDDGPHRCIRLTSSPYPGDLRRCAVLERVSPTAA
ncbi:MAG TPA: hypothetical protein VFG75_03345 [Gaiella sp.]|nr:hypothetical protein [Gaiella sp.]